MVKVRVQEQNRAAAIGRYSCMWQLGITSADAKSARARAVALVPQLRRIIRATRPRVLYTHNPADKHDTHISTLIGVLTAVRSLPKAERPAIVYGCEVWRDLDWLCDEDRVLFDVSENPQLSRDICGVFESQISGGKRYDDAVLGRRTAHATFFATHTLDFATALQYGMELTPLAFDNVPDDGAPIDAPELVDDMTRFVLAKVDRLRDNIATRIRVHA
jgi:LmbE family N-acetylglucosaminyl deacetylase